MKKKFFILATFSIIVVGIFVTTTLNREVKTTNTQASLDCPLLGNPQLISGGKCRVATNESETLVCALIDPSKPPGDQLVAGQDPESAGLPVNWNILGGTGTVQLFKEPSIPFNTGTQYRVVAYDWKDPSGCVRESGDVSGDSVVSFFAGGGSSGEDNTKGNETNPTSTPGNNLSGNNNAQFSPDKKRNNSLKESAVNMMAAILDITNTDEVSGQPTTRPTNSPSTTTTPGATQLTPGAQPTSASIDSTPNTTYTTEAQTCLKNKSIYQQAAAQTGVPWEILAGIHYVEGSCDSNKSCVSGRTIGINEPDIYGNCSSTGGKGKPIAMPGGGCRFQNLLDSCIYGANHLIGKIGRIPISFQDYAKALGRYNGTGNANCGRTPFASCPAPYEGYDHIYPMSKLDSAHQTMYLVYCADYTQCNPPKVYTRPGVLTIATILQNN